MKKRNESNGAGFGLNEDHFTIKDHPGGAHPGAEHGAVRGRLMMGMMTRMLDRLRLSHTTDGKNAEHEENRQEFEKRVVHQKMID